MLMRASCKIQPIFELQGSLMRQAAGDDSQVEQFLALGPYIFAFKLSDLTTWYKWLE